MRAISTAGWQLLSLRSVPLFVSAIILAPGCGTSRPMLDLSTFDDSVRVSYVSGRSVHTASVHNKKGMEESIRLEAFGDEILWPAWSPDATKMAFWGYDRGNIISEAITDLFSSSREITLGLYESESRIASELSRFRFGETDSELRRDNEPLRTFAPVWLHDQSLLIVADHNGLHQVSLGGQVKTIVESKDLNALCSSPVEPAVAFADGDSLFVVRFARPAQRQITSLIKRDDIRSLSFSADGVLLACVAGKDLFVYNLDTGDFAKVYSSRHGGYWTDWSADGTHLYYLKGTRNRKLRRGYPAGITARMSVVRGHFEVHSVAVDGTGTTKLYDQIEMDPRDVTPCLSPDRKHIALISRSKNARGQLFLIATDGSGVAPLWNSGQCSYPAWIPQR